MITNMATVTLPDGNATPEIHSFSPATRQGDVARWLDRDHNQGVPVGFSQLEFSVKEPSKAGGVTRVKVTIAVPKLDTTTVVPTQTGIGRFTAEFIYPGTFTELDRKHLRAFANSVLGNDKLGDNIVSMVTPY